MPDPIPYLTNDQELTSIADAIRTRGGTSAALEYPTEFVSAIEAIPSGGDVNVETSKSYTVSASGAQTISPSMGYDAMAAVALSVSAGSAGTPSATKDIYVEDGTNIITAYITPSVTNTTGWITGGTKTGTAVTVEASELVSGTYTVDSSGTKDVTNYENVSVPSGSATTPATSITANPSISVNSSTGLITATSSASQSVTPTVGAGYVSSGTAGTISVSGSNTSQLSTQSGGTITPTEAEQTAVAAGKYTLGAVKVGAISSTYVGSGIDQNDSTDLTVSGATVTAPAGYYAENASTSVPSGTVTAPASISGSSASVSTGTNTLTLSKTVSVTPNVSTAGYISSGTAGNSSVSLTASVPTQAAQTIHPSTSDQTISSGTYLTGTQTIKGVTTTNLTAANIVNGVTVKVGDSTDDDCVVSVTGEATIPSVQTDRAYTVSASGSQTISPETGYDAMDSVALTVPAGSATGPSSLNGSSATVSTGTNTLTLTKTGISTTPTVSAGYVSSATSSTATVALTASVTTQAAQIIHPSTTDQTIASGTYTTGTQTIKGVTISGLSADNIVSGVTVKIGDSTDDDCVASVTGTASGGGYFTVTDTTDTAGGTIRTITPTEGTPVVQSGRTVEITENGTTTISPSSGCTAMSDVEVTVSVAGGGTEAPDNDVIFIDYDGSIVYSYSAAEFANLTALPANPSHTGLTAQGWNWSLSDAKSYVADYEGLIIGQNYITTDSKTHIYLTLTEETLNTYVGLGVNGTVLIEWGDNNTTTLTGTSLTTIVVAKFPYTSKGDYEIKISATSGTYSIIGYSTGSQLFCSGRNINQSSRTSAYDAVYLTKVKEINIGSNCSIGSYGFASTGSQFSYLKLSLPSTLSISNQSFYYCRAKGVVIPNGITQIPNECFRDSISSYISLPKSITSFSSGSFHLSGSSQHKLYLPPNITSLNYQSICSSHYYMSKFFIPSTVTTIHYQALTSSNNLKELHFTRSTPPTISSAASWGLPPYTIIYVPYSSDHSVVQAYRTATNYPSSSTYTYLEYVKTDPFFYVKWNPFSWNIPDSNFIIKLPFSAGMTWSDYINSYYNPNALMGEVSVSWSGVFGASSGYIGLCDGDWGLEDSNGNEVVTTDLIQANYTYVVS